MASPSSSLLLDEYFAAEDERFLDELLAHEGEKKLKALAERWYADQRPFARKCLLRYVDDGCDRPHHRALVKGLFKAAERAGDDEAMGHFLAAFDGFALRRLVKHRSYDWNTRTFIESEALRPDKSVPARAPKPRRGRNPVTGALVEIPGRGLPRFSRATRRYLQRRAWRYFRRLGYRDPARYGKALRAALAQYGEEQLSRPAQLLGAWGLLHALFWGSPALCRKPGGVVVAAGHSMKELAAALFLPDTWQGCLEDVLALLSTARSRTVRSFCMTLVEGSYRDQLRQVSLRTIRTLFKCTQPEVQVFAAKLLERAEGLERLPIASWMELLRLESAEALMLVCALVKRHVSPERLTLAQCLELATARPAAVAELGLAWAKTKPIREANDLRALLTLGRAEAVAVRREAIDWVCQLLLVNEAESNPELVRELLDSQHRDVRDRGLALMGKDARFGESIVLWAAQAESPYDDVREELVRSLAHRQKAYAPDTLRHLWATALLAVHRGGRAKRQVAAQLCDRVVARRDEADALLPLLGLALRSIRPTERRLALAALAKAAHAAPELAVAISTKLPELKFLGDEVTA